MNAYHQMREMIGKVGARLAHFMPTPRKAKAKTAATAKPPAAPAPVARRPLAAMVSRPTVKPAAPVPAVTKPVRLQAVPAPKPKRTEGEKRAADSERARCAEIIASGINLGCVEQACVLAFETSLPCSEAINALSAGVAVRPTARSGLGDRMSRQLLPNIGVGCGDGLNLATAEGRAAAIVAAGAKARGEDINAPAKRPLYSQRPFVPDDLPPAA